MQPLRAGQVFAGYTIECVLGAGGMGVVYLARHPRLPRSTALKLLNRDRIFDDTIRIRFLREADNVSRLEHPNIVAVYDRGREDDQLWISMQYVAGGDAGAVMRAASRLPAARAVRIVTEAAEGLDYAHSKGVLHRDVKPANILLATAVPGRGERVLLADFGIAKSLEDTRSLTASGTLLASLPYAAPELFDSEVDVDERVDVYALGCTLFQLLTGVLPYRGTGPMQLLRDHLYAPIPKPSEVVEQSGAQDIPAGLDQVIARALAKDRAQRYRTCGELAYAAQAAIADYGRRVAETGYRPSVAARTATAPPTGPAVGDEVPHTQAAAPGSIPARDTGLGPTQTQTQPAPTGPPQSSSPPGTSTPEPARQSTPLAAHAASGSAGTSPAQPTPPPRNPVTTRPDGPARTRIEPQQTIRAETSAPEATPPAASTPRRWILIGLGLVAAMAVAATTVLFVLHDRGPSSSGATGKPASRLTATVPVGATPTAAVFDAAGHTLYVTDSDLDTISLLDTTSERVTGTVQVGKTPVGLALDATAHTVYTADIGGKTVSAVDTATRAVTTIPIGKTTARVAVDESTHTVFASNPDDNMITVIDGNTKKIVDTVAVPAFPWGMAVDPAAHRLYVAASHANQFVVIDTTTHRLVTTIPTPALPGRIAVDPATNTAYVTHENDSEVSVIDLATSKVTAIPAGAKPIGIACDSAIHTLYVTNINDSTISVVDTTNYSNTNTIKIGTKPSAVAIDPTSHNVYVTDEKDNTVMILESQS